MLLYDHYMVRELLMLLYYHMVRELLMLLYDHYMVRGAPNAVI